MVRISFTDPTFLCLFPDKHPSAVFKDPLPSVCSIAHENTNTSNTIQALYELKNISTSLIPKWKILIQEKIAR